MPQAVTFAAKDGQETHAQLLLPRETSSKPHPAILFFHGALKTDAAGVRSQAYV